jgi:hypothetical protein
MRDSSPPDTIRERPKILTDVGRHEKFGMIDPTLGPALLAGPFPVEPHLESRPRHRQLCEMTLDLRGKRFRRETTPAGEVAREIEIPLPRVGKRAVQIVGRLLRARQQPTLPCERGAGCDHVLQRWTVLPLQPLDQCEPILHLLQSPRRRVYLVAVATQQEGQIFELRLDGVSRLELVCELRFDSREFPNSLPDLRQPREDGLIAVVECGVRLFAQALNPFGVRKHLLRGRQLFVFAGLQRGLLDLAELKGNQLEARRFFAIVHPGTVALLPYRSHGRPRTHHRRNQ